VLALAREIEAMADSAAQVSSASGIPSRGAPALDEHAEAHSRTTRRLFHA
jgi:urease accessory protein